MTDYLLLCAVRQRGLARRSGRHGEGLPRAPGGATITVYETFAVM
jgi:hypothetical protein